MTALSPGGTFRHEALFYEDDRSYLEGTVPFIEAGLRAGERVLVAVPRQRIALIQANTKGASPELLSFVAMERAGKNPAWIMPLWAAFVAARRDGAALRGVGEPLWPGRTEDEIVECERHEVLLNAAFAATANFSMLCPYDIATLRAAAVDESRRSHPHISQDGSHRNSDVFTGEVPLFVERPLSDPPDSDVHTFDFDGRSHRDVRRRATAIAAAAGLAGTMFDDFELVVAEAMSNSMRHGGGAGRLLIWCDEASIVVEVRDRGTIDRPLAGRVRPSTDMASGRGLWIMHQLSDLVQIRRLPDHQVVRVRFNR